MKNPNQLLINILRNKEQQPRQLLRPFFRKLFLINILSILVCVSVFTLLVIALQTSIQPSLEIFIYSVLIAAISIICLTGLFFFFLSRRISAPLSELLITAEKIHRGEYGTQATVVSDDEIGHLSKIINSMSTQLHDLQLDKRRAAEQLEEIVDARTRRIQMMHNRLEQIIQTSSQGFWRVDNDMITKEINPRMAAILKLPQETVIGRSIMDFVNIPNRTILHKQIHMGKSCLSTEYEIEIQQENGGFIPCLFNATPLLNEQGEKIGSFVLVSDISALKNTEEQLLAAKRQAEHANHMKSAFLANMSHEIRTPLNGIIGSLELLQDQNLSPVQKEQFMNTARESADFLLTLLNDILDLSKIEADKVEIEKVAFMPNILLKQLHTMFHSQAKNKGLQLSITADETVPEIILGDEVRLTQVCTNLLSNAIKFTKEGSVSMSFTCKSGGDGYVLLSCCVQDTGIGLSKEQQEIIFDSFSQADTSTTREFGGTGLGLALCKKLCFLMGGEIWVESVEGEGSTFSFHVLCGIGQLNLLSVAKREIEEPAEDTIKIQPLSILVVDDNTVNRDVAMMFLAKDGHRVETAINGLEALKKLIVSRFDCIFMDIQMPGIDGVSATSIIRDCEQNTLPLADQCDPTISKKLCDKIQNTHTPIIALTANVFQSDKQRYLQAGMDDYLAKPIRKKDVVRVLHNLAGRSKSEERNGNDAPSTNKKAEMILDKQASLPVIYQYLKEMYSFKPSQIDTLIATSAKSLFEALDTLDQSYTAKDKKALAECAHSIKGSLLNLGLNQLSDIAKSIEISAKNNEEQPYDQWISELRQKLDPLKEVL